MGQSSAHGETSAAATQGEFPPETQAEPGGITGQPSGASPAHTTIPPGLTVQTHTHKEHLPNRNMVLLLIATGEEEEHQLVLKTKHSIITCPTPHLNKIPDKLIKMWLHRPHRSCKGGEILGASGSAGAGLAEP